MSRKYVYALLACLLSLLHASSFAQSLTKCEYWIDDDFDNRKAIALSGAEDEIDTEIDMASLTSGAHDIFFRFRQSDGAWSAITSRRFTKLGLSDSKLLEYWFDGNRDEVHRLPGVTSSEEEALDFNTVIDCTNLSTGFHTVSFRVVSQNGLIGSSVITKSFFKYEGLGSAKILEYWFDDNRKDVYRIAGTVSEKGDMIDFIKDVDLNKLTPGHHRLFYRVVSKNGHANSAISMTPIMVNSKYDNIDLADLTMTEYAYWIDDEEPEIISKANPKQGLRLNEMLDTRRLSNGQHTLHVQFGNSAGIWNGPVDATFTKTKVADPVITADATVKDGIVTVNFNTIPFGVGYTLVRKYPSGKIRNASDFIKHDEYPVTHKATDTPAPGTYTYYVNGKYTDAEGVIQEALSNDVSVTVDEAATGTVKWHDIQGIVKFDGVQKTKGYTLYINGEKEDPSKYRIDKYGLGHFCIRNIHEGAEITIGVKSSGYKFNDLTLIVGKNTHRSTYRFNGTKSDEDEDDVYALSDYAGYDLSLVDKVHITPRGLEVEVRNISNKTWSGNIIVKMISKKEKEFFENDLFWGYYLFYPSAVNKDPNPQTVADMPVKILGNKDKKTPTVLTLDIINLPEGNESEDYYVYVFSKKNGTEEIKELYGGTYNYYSNPQTLNFNPSEYTQGEGGDYQSYIEDYKCILRHLKEMTKWGDPFALEINSFGKGFDKIIENLGKHTIDVDGLERDLIVGVSQSAGMLLNCFLSDIHKAIKQAAKSTTESLKPANDIIKVYDTLNEFYSSNTVDDNHKFFETAKQVLKLCETLDLKKFLALGIYKNYLDVGAKMADKVKAIENFNDNRWLWERLVAKDAIFNIKVRRYSSNNSFEGYFRGEDVYKQIESIDIVLSHPLKSDSDIPGIFSKPIFDEDGYGITIKNVDFRANNALYDNGTEAWMTIIWKNKRVTHVPLLDKNFVKLENFDANSKKPLTMTVELQSGSNLNKDNMANQLTFVK